MTKKAENSNTPLQPSLDIAGVSGSFSMFEVKDLLWYGETRDLKVILKENPRKIGDLDIALDMMFDLLEKHTYMDRKRVENVFWNRVMELTNYR
jgi:hypothetical protein